MRPVSTPPDDGEDENNEQDDLDEASAESFEHIRLDEYLHEFTGPPEGGGVEGGGAGVRNDGNDGNDGTDPRAAAARDSPSENNRAWDHIEGGITRRQRHGEFRDGRVMGPDSFDGPSQSGLRGRTHLMDHPNRDFEGGSAGVRNDGIDVRDLGAPEISGERGEMPFQMFRAPFLGNLSEAITHGPVIFKKVIHLPPLASPSWRSSNSLRVLDFHPQATTAEPNLSRRTGRIVPIKPRMFISLYGHSQPAFLRLFSLALALEFPASLGFPRSGYYGRTEFKSKNRAVKPRMFISFAGDGDLNSPGLLSEKPALDKFLHLGCRLCPTWKVWKISSGGVTSTIRRHLKKKHAEIYYPTVKRPGLKHADDTSSRSRNDEPFTLDGWNQ
ncbi:hypothetical protein DFH09DRAFT_1083956 [Mycena vulgaris]|nr:hypothetical protein DFH09DRAFT_1083956 [Mycena vulgaris]